MSDVRLVSSRERALAPYPIRRLIRPNWTDRSVRRITAELAQMFKRRRMGNKRFVAGVLRKSAKLDQVDDAELLGLADEMRMRLARRAFTETSLSEAFALSCAAICRETGMSLRPVQIHGAKLLIEGSMVEMATGEGKSATAVLAAGAAALAGWRPHVVTVNDYLAKRDHETFKGVFDRLGLRLGLVQGEMQPAERSRQYRSDAIYVNNKEVAFDFLKDRIALGQARSQPRAALRRAFGGPDDTDKVRSTELIHDGLLFAIIDEADSVLVDEAGTPLIISRGDDDAPDPEPYLTALSLAQSLQKGRDWKVDSKHRQIELTETGKERVLEVASGLGGLWEVARAREERLRQALAASRLYIRDQQYVIQPKDGKPTVQIVDEFTGRVMPDRSWEGGLHQMIEAKEGVPLTAPRRTLTRITYPRYFAGYLRLSGMTGTGMEIAGEMQAIFGLRTVPVPSYRPNRRQSMGLRLVRTEKRKWDLVAKRCASMSKNGRAVLVGTRSVEASEALSEVLSARGLEHSVLNARQDADEAAMIARAGQEGQITVATNMAGRGTDIVPTREVEAKGGLHVILTEHHESRRIDRQLHGRCARQGDRGTIEEIVALDDELYQRYVPLLLGVLVRLGPLGRISMFASLLRYWMQLRAERASATRRWMEARRDDEDAKTFAVSGTDLN